MTSSAARTRTVLSLVLALITGGAFAAGCGDNKTSGGGDGDASVTPDAALDGDAEPDADIVPDADLPLADDLYGPLAYLETADSPFAGEGHEDFFHLEDFEDALLNTPGVTASVGAAGPFGALTDSVDGDDGVVDGVCLDGNDWFSGAGSTGITFTFDAVALGALPTHAGIVWTDGGAGCSVTFQAYNGDDELIDEVTLEDAGDDGITGQVEEDRFFGIVSSGGVKSIFISNSSGGIEVDHLQYGR